MFTLVLINYRAQKKVIELMVKNHLMDRQQNDINNILDHSSDGLLVFQQ